MKDSTERRTGRRNFLLSSAAVMGSSFWADETIGAVPQNTKSNSKPSDLKITDLRVATIARAPFTCPSSASTPTRASTGYGEVRDGASKTYALMLKSRILGRESLQHRQNISAKIKQFGFHARQGGGVCGIEMALWDLAGKAYNVPVYQMLGGKFRDRIRCYADTDTSRRIPRSSASRLKARMDQGFTWLKMDLGIGLVDKTAGHGHAACRAEPGRNATTPSTCSRAIEHHPQGHRDDGRLRGAGARSHRDGNPARRRPLRPYRRELLHPAGQGAREVQPGLAGGHDPVAVHGPVEARSRTRSTSPP